jgi:hypothetical protein
LLETNLRDVPAALDSETVTRDKYAREINLLLETLCKLYFYVIIPLAYAQKHTHLLPKPTNFQFSLRSPALLKLQNISIVFKATLRITQPFSTRRANVSSNLQLQ